MSTFLSVSVDKSLAGIASAGSVDFGSVISLTVVGNSNVSVIGMFIGDSIGAGDLSGAFANANNSGLTVRATLNVVFSRWLIEKSEKIILLNALISLNFFAWRAMD